MRQVCQGFGHAIPLQVRRARAVDHRHAAHPPRYHSLIGLGADAHHAIKTFGDQVHLAVRTADLHVDQRMARHERGQVRQDHAPRHDVGHVHPYAPGQLGFVLTEQTFQLFHMRQQILAALIQHTTILGRLHLARGALQQPCAEQLLQRLHMLGDRRARQAQTLTGLGKARQLSNAYEGAQQLKFVHGIVRLIRPVIPISACLSRYGRTNTLSPTHPIRGLHHDP